MSNREIPSEDSDKQEQDRKARAEEAGLAPDATDKEIEERLQRPMGADLSHEKRMKAAEEAGLSPDATWAEIIEAKERLPVSSLEDPEGAEEVGMPPDATVEEIEAKRKKLGLENDSTELGE